MAREQQLSDTGAPGKEKKDENGKEAKPAAGEPAKAEKKLTLFERLGGQQGIAAIIEDFIPRVLQDPRVNWSRQGVTVGGFLRRDRSIAWNPTPENVAKLKQHMAQFIALATGGPADYNGKAIPTSHADMKITNPEFDAVIGDLKASLDKLKIPDQEQKELLAIFESTRPQIVTVR